jgi:hypothetical protein
VFWAITLCNLVGGYNVSEKHITYYCVQDYAASYLRRPQSKFTPPRKPQISNCHVHTPETQHTLISLVIQTSRSESILVELLIENPRTQCMKNLLQAINFLFF